MVDLAQILKHYVNIGEYTLASGRKSRYYVDIKKASTNPAILKKISQKASEILNSISADYVGGVALGGVPIAVAVSLETCLPMIIIRKESKEYGTKALIEGEIQKGKEVVLIEDVVTTGGSVLKAIETLRNAGLEIRYVVAVVDREEGAEKALSNQQVKLISLVRISELVQDYHG